MWLPDVGERPNELVVVVERPGFELGLVDVEPVWHCTREHWMVGPGCGTHSARLEQWLQRSWAEGMVLLVVEHIVDRKQRRECIRPMVELVVVLVDRMAGARTVVGLLVVESIEWRDWPIEPVVLVDQHRSPIVPIGIAWVVATIVVVDCRYVLEGCRFVERGRPVVVVLGNRQLVLVHHFPP